jgi:hypothetical protein
MYEKDFWSVPFQAVFDYGRPSIGEPKDDGGWSRTYDLG